MEENELIVVSLPEPSRRCVLCAEATYLAGRETEHDSFHASQLQDTRYLPADWEVSGPTSGIDLATGTPLRLLGARHQVFHGPSDEASVQWLLEATDGPTAGEIYYVVTRTHDEPVDAATWPAVSERLWPRGLTPALRELASGVL